MYHTFAIKEEIIFISNYQKLFLVYVVKKYRQQTGNLSFNNEKRLCRKIHSSFSDLFQENRVKALKQKLEAQETQQENSLIAITFLKHVDIPN